jgi:hypothetical protein
VARLAADYGRIAAPPSGGRVIPSFPRLLVGSPGPSELEMASGDAWLWKTPLDRMARSEHCLANNLTVKQRSSTVRGVSAEPDDISVGFLLGLLVGEGHFGGDGRQPQVTLRMHIRHEQTFEWLRRTYPGSALYGPYHHGGRSYYQWSARGRYLREYLAPLVQRHRSLLDAYTAERFDTMCERYAIALGAGAGAPEP